MMTGIPIENNIWSAYLLIAFLVIVGFAFYDIFHRRVPDLALVFFIPLAAAAPLIKSWFALDCGQPPLWLWPIFAKSLIGALLGFSIPLAAAIVTGGTGIGGGDIKFCGVLGLIYGPSGMSIVFLVSAVCAMPIILMIRRIYRDRRPLSIPFLPFLACGCSAATLAEPIFMTGEMLMKLNNRFIFGILSLVLAAVIAFVALPTIARQTNGKTEIVRITQPVLKGEKITSDNAEVVEVGGYNLPSNVAHSMEDVEGLYVTADLAEGDYILTSKVSSVPVSSDVALNDIPSGKVAISMTVKTLASGLSDKLQPNDIIRIYHFLETAEEVPELRFVKVLSVTDSDGVNVDNTKEPTEDEERQQSATITVLATPEQARIITEMENDGVAHVALISRNNDQLAEELLAAQDKTLQEIYFPETLTEDSETAEGSEPTAEDGSAGPDSDTETPPAGTSQPAE